MKKLILISGLVTAAGLLPGLAAAQDVGKVISSTPLTRQVTEPRTTCSDDANGRQSCRTERVTEERNVGYKVVYEYAGKQYTTQMSSPPGAVIELEVTPTVRGAMPASSRQPQPTYTRQPQPAVYSSDSQPAAYSSDPQPVYSSEAPVVERVVREPVYVEQPVYIERPYYPAPYYYSGYYSPWYPLAGVALGFTVGHYSRPYRGGWYGHGGHWRR
jgi:hypothetical protein